MSWVNLVADLDILDVQWADRPDDEVAQFLLDAAHEQCVDFAPTAPAVIPANWKLAEMLQARALHRAGYVGSGNQSGSDFPVTIYPMDWTVQNLLRPKLGVPVVG